MLIKTSLTDWNIKNQTKPGFPVLNAKFSAISYPIELKFGMYAM